MRPFSLPPSMSQGFRAAFAKGAPYLVTFFVVFTFTQSIGGLIGSAFYGTLIIIREKFPFRRPDRTCVVDRPRRRPAR